jgi:hypothetical protein
MLAFLCKASFAYRADTGFIHTDNKGSWNPHPPLPNQTCKAFKTIELPKEKSACLHKAATKDSQGGSGGGQKTKELSLKTYKLHALGDYPQTIRELAPQIITHHQGYVDAIDI